MFTPPFVVRPVEWAAHGDKLREVRRSVFIEEQGVPEALEWDDADERAHHVIALEPRGAPIGTGRMKIDHLTGRIGRMAVLKPWRGHGVGSAILEALLEIAVKQGCGTLRLHSQAHALNFYSHHGFRVVSSEFEEAGIAHRVMELSIASAASEPTTVRHRP